MQLADHFLAIVVTFPVEAPKGTPGALPVPAGWRAIPAADEALFRAHLQQKYYPHFLRSMHPGASDTAQRKTIEPAAKDPGLVAGVGVSIQCAELRSFTSGVGMATIFLRMEGQEMTLAQLDNVAGLLREPSTVIDQAGGKRSLHDLVTGLVAGSGVDGAALLAHGPNFKVFVNGVLELQELEDPHWDQHLFELATGLPQGGMQESYAPTESYMRQQIDGHGLKLFRNWRALALFDTFTRLAIRSEDQHKTWERDYLCIFQYVLMLRAQALELSARLGRTALNDISLLDLRDQWLAFRNEVDTAFVSYKWLPNELFAKMMAGTNTLHEITRADERLERMVQRFRERRARNLTRVGLVLLGLILVLLFAFSDLF